MQLDSTRSSGGDDLGRGASISPGGIAAPRRLSRTPTATLLLGTPVVRNPLSQSGLKICALDNSNGYSHMIIGGRPPASKLERVNLFSRADLTLEHFIVEPGHDATSLKYVARNAERVAP